MNCINAQQHIHDWFDSVLPADLTRSVQAHLDDCAECSEKFKKEQELRNLMRSLPVAPAHDGFYDKVWQRAKRQADARQHKRQGFLQGIGVALAASVCLWAVLSLFPSLISQNTNDDGLRIALHETHNLKLAFYAHKDIKNATVSIYLPQNVALVGYPGQNKLSWQVNLAKGDNSLSLPIKGLQTTVGELVAKIEHGQQSKILTVKLRITEPGVSQLDVLPQNVS